MQATNVSSQYVGHVIRHHSKIAYHGLRHAISNPAVTNSVTNLSMQAVNNSQATTAAVVIAREAVEQVVKNTVRSLKQARA